MLDHRGRRGVLSSSGLVIDARTHPLFPIERNIGRGAAGPVDCPGDAYFRRLPSNEADAPSRSGRA